MGLTEELKSLEEMNTKGTLTSDEFAAAKAAALSNARMSAVSTQIRLPEPEPTKTKGPSGVIAALVAVLTVILVAGAWFANDLRQRKASSNSEKSAVHQVLLRMAMELRRLTSRFQPP
jgi:uncharacterized protein HemX